MARARIHPIRWWGWMMISCICITLLVSASITNATSGSSSDDNNNDDNNDDNNNNNGQNNNNNNSSSSQNNNNNNGQNNNNSSQNNGQNNNNNNSSSSSQNNGQNNNNNGQNNNNNGQSNNNQSNSQNNNNNSQNNNNNNQNNGQNNNNNDFNNNNNNNDNNNNDNNNNNNNNNGGGGKGEVVNLGVNWGAQATHQMLPDTVVQMIKDNGIKKVKLFDADSWTVKALAGTGIEVMVAIPNDQLSHFSGKYDHAKDWVKQNVSKHIYDGGVDIKYVAVGNEPFLKAYNGSFMKTTFPSLQNIQKALNEAGLGDKIKATIPLNADVYESANDKPSGGKFRDDIKDLMNQIVKFLHDNKAPFVVNIYPFLSLYQNPNFPFEFAFFDGGGRSTQDGNFQYTNVFDANYDTLVNALKRAGVPDLKVVVGEVGWPTDGNKFATPDLAKKFYSGFLKRMANKKGTPLRPGHLDVYLFSLIDEDLKSIAPGNFERHWGIFRYDGQPKFPVDLTGQGHEKYLVGAKGVEYLEKQWCVFDKEKANDMSTVPEDMNYACSLGDCTSLGYGSSCNNLDMYGNISYAFNMYFQMQDQDVQACDFHGTAKLTTENASTGNCLFPVQIVNAGERIEFTTLTSTLLLSLIVLVLL